MKKINKPSWSMREDILCIADTQVYEGVPLEHIHALARYIWKHKPKYIIHIGDNWDFPSLSFYSSPLQSEGRRLVDDLKAGFDALKIITEYINIKNKVEKKKAYKPNLHFIMGNHEQRLNTMMEKNPHLSGIVDLKGDIEKLGWVVNDFLEPLWINEVMFIHYMPNPFSGKPIGGGIENKMNKHPHSFVHGHVQIFQFGRRQNMAGKPHFGACAGAFYNHDEEYRGPNNTEIRGFLHLIEFKNRYDYLDYDVMFVSLERLLNEYKT